MIWQQPPGNPVLDSNRVHVWAIDLDHRKRCEDTLVDVLSEDECARANRFRFEKDRAHYVAARGRLRVILGCYLKCSPGEVAFDYGEHGKPFLSSKWTDSGVQFNLSHSHGLALVALAVGRAVGVDVEHLNRKMDNRNRLAKRFFAPGEYQRLCACPDAEQVGAFFRCWTRKEAFIKAIGQGLTFPLKDFEVSLDNDARLLHLVGDEVDRWTLLHLEPGDGYIGAVAVEGRGIEVECWKEV